MDIDFNIIIPNFVGAANIDSISNYTKAQNEADKEGANNNSQGGTGNNNKDNNNKENISGVKTQREW